MKTFLTLTMTIACIVTYAQKKPKINQALSAMNAGDLIEAKSIIDLAIVHEKTKNNPKTWYYRGQIYASLDTANNEPGAMEEALNAFDKVLELDPEQKEINSLDINTGQIVNVSSKRNGYYAFYYNNAIVAYNAESYTVAADNFEKAFYINPSDTNAILNAGYSALADNDDKRAENNFMKSYEMGSRELKIFLLLYNYAIKKNRFEDALDIITKGRKAYPDNVDFMKHEVNLLIELDKIEEAKMGLEKAIESGSNNPDLYFTLGVIQEELGNLDKALESYRKAIENNPNHYNSNFNLGVSIFNEANELIKDKNKLDYRNKSKYSELSKKIDLVLKKCLPIWEKLYALNSVDRTVLETLSYIYSSLKMDDQATKIQNELDALDN